MEGERGRASACAGAIRSLPKHLDAFVSPAITPPAERRLHAATIGGLVAIGLAAAMVYPGLVVLGAPAILAAFPLVLAGLALGTAWLVAATGALDQVLWLAGTVLFAVLAAAAALDGAVLALILPVLVILPAEAMLLSRRRLAAGLAASALAAAGASISLAEGPLDLGFAHILPLAAMLAYAGRILRHRTALATVTAAASEASRERALADFCGAALVVLDGRGRILSVSAAAGAMLGTSDEETADTMFAERVHVADRVEVLRALGEAARLQPQRRIAARIGGAGPGYRQVVLTIGPNPAASEPGTIFVAIAVPEVAAGQAEALEAALAAATQASSAKSQFLAAMSHELRTPLNAIIGFSDILDQEFFGGFESVRQKEYVGLIRQSGQHLLSVVNTLLDVSKIEAGRYELTPEPFRIAEAIAEVGELMHDEARRKGLRIDIRSACGDAMLVADRRALQQVLLNLLSNAVKFTDDGVVTVESRVDGEAVELDVSDTGIGIAEDDLKRLGQPFVQVSTGTTRRYPGTGLGLSLVKGLVELHGGTITVTSDPGVGTMVSIRLPQKGRPAPAETSNTQENIIAFSDARTKTTHQTQARETRRSA